MSSEYETLDVPAEFISVAADWHGGQSTCLYSVLSTGMVWASWVEESDDPDDDPEIIRALCSLWAEVWECYQRSLNWADEKAAQEQLNKFLQWIDRQEAIIRNELENSNEV